MTKEEYKIFARDVRVHGLTLALRTLNDVSRETVENLSKPKHDYLAARAARYIAYPNMRNDWVIKLTTPAHIFTRFYPDYEGT